MDYNVNFSAKGVTDITNANGKVIASFDQTDRTLVKTDKSLAAYNAQSMKAAKNCNSLAGALEIANANIEHANGLYGKAMAGAMSLAGAYKGLTGGVAAFGLVLKKLPKLLNPYIFVVQALLDKLMALFEWFISKPAIIEEESKKIEEAAKKEAEAIKQLSDVIRQHKDLVTADMAAQELMRKQTQNKWREDYAAARQKEYRLIKDIAIAEADLQDKRKQAHKEYISQGFGRGLWGEEAIKNEEAYIDKYTNVFKTKVETLKKELETMRQTLIEGNRQVLVNNLDLWYKTTRDFVYKVWDNLGKVKDEALNKKGKGAKKDNSWLKEYEDGLKYLEELERKWLHKLRDDQKHSHEELARIAIEEEKEDARRRLKNAEQLQKALYLIEGRGQLEIKLAREKDEKEEAERIAAMERRVAARIKRLDRLFKAVNKGEKGLEYGEGEEQNKVLQAWGLDKQTLEGNLERVKETLEEFTKLSTEERAKTWYQEKELADLQLKLESDLYTRKIRFLEDYARAAKRDHAERLRQQLAFSKSTNQAIKSNVEGLNIWADALRLFDKDCTAVQALQMTASGIQAGADAVNYNAEAIKAFAIGDIGRGIGLEMAAAGKVAAVIAYAKGLMELGSSSGGVEEPNLNTGRTSTQSNVSSLAGSSNEHQTIDINMMYSWGDSKIAQALIMGLNSTANNPGQAKLNPQLIARY